MSDSLRQLLAEVAATFDPEPIEFALERPRDPSHGDLSTNVAMQLARRLRTKPRDLAERFVATLTPRLADGVAIKDIAGPGFINFQFALDTVASSLTRILAEGPRFGRSQQGDARKVNVEFVSANPTGPLHVGHGRGAALGDGIGALLEWTGHQVTREFYVNDAGVQINRLAESLWARVQQAVGRNAEIPEGGYHGAYLNEAADELLQREGKAFADLETSVGVARCRAAVLVMQRAEQDETLAKFGVQFDVISSEQRLYDDGSVAAGLKRLADVGLTFEEGGAVWLRTSAFGDDRDRVLRKSDGSYTYLVPDIAYHLDKFGRGFQHVIDVWGADHHGYIPRMQAALTALGIPAGWLDVAIVQLVRVVRGTEEVKMSKRSGEFVTLRDLYEETGVDAARYWFLMRRGDSHLVFDIDLAKSQTDENPVYYVQMAHARMCGIERNALAAGITLGGAPDISALSEDDVALIKTLAYFPDLVARSAEASEPHRITTWLEELARAVHAWYHKSRVIGETPAVQNARLHVARATRQVIANALALLGITAPERM